jgi:hypothetical protein
MSFIFFLIDFFEKRQYWADLSKRVGRPVNKNKKKGKTEVHTKGSPVFVYPIIPV